MTPKIVEKKLLEILNGKMQLRKTITDKDSTTLLTSREIGLNYIRMIEFLMCVEESFGVIFPLDELREGGFRTIHDISTLICRMNCSS